MIECEFNMEKCIEVLLVLFIAHSGLYQLLRKSLVLCESGKNVQNSQFPMTHKVHVCVP